MHPVGSEENDYLVIWLKFLVDPQEGEDYAVGEPGQRGRGQLRRPAAPARRPPHEGQEGHGVQPAGPAGRGPGWRAYRRPRHTDRVNLKTSETDRVSSKTRDTDRVNLTTRNTDRINSKTDDTDRVNSKTRDSDRVNSKIRDTDMVNSKIRGP